MSTALTHGIGTSFCSSFHKDWNPDYCSKGADRKKNPHQTCQTPALLLLGYYLYIHIRTTAFWAYHFAHIILLRCCFPDYTTVRHKKATVRGRDHRRHYIRPRATRRKRIKNKKRRLIKMNKRKICNLVEQCIEKAANDFLAGKSVDHQGLYAIQESVRILHHVQKINSPSTLTDQMEDRQEDSDSQ